jgi:hypothetical protein
LVLGLLNQRISKNAAAVVCSSIIIIIVVIVIGLHAGGLRYFVITAFVNAGTSRKCVLL